MGAILFLVILIFQFSRDTMFFIIKIYKINFDYKTLFKL